MFEVESDGRTASAPIALSAPLEGLHPGIETALLVIHGEDGDPTEWMREFAATAARNAADEKLFIAAPQFLDESDVDPDNIDDFLTARWTNDDWADGATASRPTHVLSYHVAETVLRRLADARAFPDLKRVAVVGFSAGGTFVQRLAMISEAADSFDERNIPIRFVVASAWSYLYFGAERPQGDGGFAVPVDAECTGYNDWPYGPREAPNTLKEQDKPVRFFAERYATRDVVYLVGAQETAAIDDGDCAGRLQGASLADRLASYLLYMKARWPDFSHGAVVVPDKGHAPSMLSDLPPVWELLMGATPEAVRTKLQDMTGEPI